MEEVLFVELPIFGINEGRVVRRLAPQDGVLTNPIGMVAGLVHAGWGPASDAYTTPAAAQDIAVGDCAYVESPELSRRYGRTTWRIAKRVERYDEDAARAAVDRLMAAEAALAAAKAALFATRP